jgi:hypothetical protein
MRNVPSWEPEHSTWILEATDKELDEYIFEFSGNAVLKPKAEAERTRRHFAHLSRPVEPHWTVLPSYRVLWATLITTILLFVFTVFAWWFPRPVENKKIPTSQPVTVNQSTSIYIPKPVLSATNLLPAQAATSQTSSPAIYTTSHTNILSR